VFEVATLPGHRLTLAHASWPMPDQVRSGSDKPFQAPQRWEWPPYPTFPVELDYRMETTMEYEISPCELTPFERDELLDRAQALNRILLMVDRPDVRDADGIRHGVMPARLEGEDYHLDDPEWRLAYAAGMDDMLAWVRGLLLCATPASGVDMNRLEREYRAGERSGTLFVSA